MFKEHYSTKRNHRLWRWFRFTDYTFLIILLWFSVQCSSLNNISFRLLFYMYGCGYSSSFYLSFFWALLSFPVIVTIAVPTFILALAWEFNHINLLALIGAGCIARNKFACTDIGCIFQNSKCSRWIVYNRGGISIRIIIE